MSPLMQILIGRTMQILESMGEPDCGTGGYEPFLCLHNPAPLPRAPWITLRRTEFIQFARRLRES